VSEFYVVACVMNPMRYQSRYRLYHQFAEHLVSSGVRLLTVEVAYGDLPFAVTEPGNQMHLQLRTWDILWHKENAINLGVSRLPADWRYVAWIDADIQFINPDWARETVHQLQHHPVVQLWQDCLDLGPTGEVIGRATSFGYYWQIGQPMSLYWQEGYKSGHPGFAWAMQRSAFDEVGGLLDTAILGAGDHHMCGAFVGKWRQTTRQGVHPNYQDEVGRWADRAKALRQDVGFVPGTILHHWHGSKVSRLYQERWEILIKHQFDPRSHLKRDWQGLYQLHQVSPALRDDLRRYFRARNEDSVDPPPPEQVTYVK